MTGFDEALALAGRLADAAAAEIRPRFRQPLASECKHDLTPVTEADRAAERAVRAVLAKERPDDGIAGEEYDAVHGRSGLTWVIDPIDGTKAFITGRPTFATLIALMDGEHPVLGVIDQPITGDRWIGVAGRPTVLNGKPVRVRACGGLQSASFSTTAPDLFPAADEPVYREIAAAAAIRTYGGDGYAYGLLASGWIDVVLESGLKLHDLAALVPVVQGAGGKITDWSGAPLTAKSKGDVLAVGDHALHGELVRVIGRLR